MGAYTDSSSDIHVFDAIKEEPKIFLPRRTQIDYVKDAPSFPINKIANLAQKIYLDLMYNLKGERMTPEECDNISRRICRAIGYPVRKRATVYESLYPAFMATDINSRLIYQMAVRIAGNIEYIRRDEIIPMWDMTTDVWAPVEVIGSEIHYCRVPAREVRIFVTGGIPAGGHIVQNLSNKFLQYMMREVGYPTYKTFGSDEIYNLKFTAMVGRDRSKVRMLAFHVAENQRKYNSELYKIRHGGCPFQYECGCGKCLKGTNDCPGALHRKTYEAGDCVNGHRGAMCDDPKGRCTTCIEKDRKEAYFKAMEERHGRENTEGSGSEEQVFEHGELPQGKAEVGGESGVLRTGGGHYNGAEARAKHDAQGVQ